MNLTTMTRKEHKNLYITKRQQRKAKGDPTNNVVVYTRVSTKEQFDSNASLSTQKRVCLDYANKNGFTVVKLFGDTFESAKSDTGRKEFQSMMDYVKKHKKDLHAVIVYDYSRFSRSEENIGLVNGLRKMGVEVMAATQPADTQSSSGRLSRALQLLLANFDNEQKSERTKAGILEKLKQGIWPTKLPIGYSKNPLTKAVEIDYKGILIREAFYLVAAGESITSVMAQMEKRGLKLDLRRWGDLFNNPFYAGLIVHRLLDYEPVEGVHPSIVSLDVWQKVKQIRSGKELTHTYQENVQLFPLKGFMACTCGRMLTAYQAKKKTKPNGRFFYYKCNNQGCRVNVATKVAEEAFGVFLSGIKLNPSLQQVFKKQLKETYVSYSKESISKKRKLEEEIRKYDEKRVKLTDKWLYDDLEKSVYEEHKALLEEGKAKAVHERNLLETDLSNPNEFIELSTFLAQNLDKLWSEGHTEVKRRLQGLVFPQGVFFEKKTMTYRTPEINVVFKGISSESMGSENKKNGEASNSADSSVSVPWAGVEPARVLPHWCLRPTRLPIPPPRHLLSVRNGMQT